VFRFERGLRNGAAALAALLAPGCGREPAEQRRADIDDFGDTVAIAAPATRIVSLGPATTELLFALGAGPRLVGRSHWDLFPDSARAIADLGDGIRPNVEAIFAARPDLVVLYASADNRDAARALRAAGVRVLALRVDRIRHFERAVRVLGTVTGQAARARVVADSVRATLDRVRVATAGLPRPTVFLHSWENPLLTIGAGSYLSELVAIAGGRNVFDDLPAPSPQIAFEEVLRRRPEVVLAGPVTAATLQSIPRWRSLDAVRLGRILLMDTLLVGRPGVRLGEAAVSIAALLHPGAVR
jgi:ABC-type Fe3+-hydroxamate transport system substrate-binding protein